MRQFGFHAGVESAHIRSLMLAKILEASKNYAHSPQIDPVSPPSGPRVSNRGHDDGLVNRSCYGRHFPCDNDSIPASDASVQVTSTPLPAFGASVQVTTTPLPAFGASVQVTTTPLPAFDVSVQVTTTPLPAFDAFVQVTTTPLPAFRTSLFK